MTDAVPAEHELDEDTARLYAAVDALPPLTDAQLDAIGETLLQIRLSNR